MRWMVVGLVGLLVACGSGVAATDAAVHDAAVLDATVLDAAVPGSDAASCDLATANRCAALETTFSNELRSLPRDCQVDRDCVLIGSAYGLPTRDCTPSIGHACAS